MNVIFIDFDGTLDTFHRKSKEDIENRIRILADICHKYDCKVVITSGAKSAIDEYTLETDVEWIQHIFSMFKKYDIECIGRTPNVSIEIAEGVFMDMWKEAEIIAYLMEHPEIEHFCVVDDDDLQPRDSDLNKVRDYLVTTIEYSDNPEEEGLLQSHSDEIGMILKKKNRFKKEE